jgi:osmoprotectant transport system substrate-binding protein
MTCKPHPFLPGGALVGAALLTALLPAPALSCVGRKLVFGSLSDVRGAMVSRVLSILVHERTGTTVELVFFPGESELRSAAREGKVDLFVGYAGTAQPAEQALADVRRRDEEEANLAWGKMLGCQGFASDGTARGPAAPVVRKDTLKKFPALPRLLEKVGSKVALTDEVVRILLDKAGDGREEKAARDWLREVKLI